MCLCTLARECVYRHVYKISPQKYGNNSDNEHLLRTYVTDSVLSAVHVFTHNTQNNPMTSSNYYFVIFNLFFYPHLRAFLNCF